VNKSKFGIPLLNVKDKVDLCLIEHIVMKIHVGVEVEVHAL
jgi:hypothetical protein